MNFNAAEVVRRLTETNILAQENGFRFCLVSGLEGMEEAVQTMQSTRAFVCVFDNSVGYADLENLPRTNRTFTIAFAMRYPQNGTLSETAQAARLHVMRTLRELFRQFASAMMREQYRIENDMQYLNSRMTMQEASKYLIPGTAVLITELTVQHYIDMQYDPKEWNDGTDD